MSSRLAIWSILGLTLTFLIGPFLIIVAAALSAGNNLAFPPQGYSLKWVVKVFEVESFRFSFGVSMFLAVFGTLAALVLGVPAAYGLSRYRVFGGEAVRLALSSPIIVPGIIVGLALLRYLVIPTGVTILTALFFAHTALVLPYAVRVVSASLEKPANGHRGGSHAAGMQQIRGVSSGRFCRIFAAAYLRHLFWDSSRASIRCPCRCFFRGRAFERFP